MPELLAFPGLRPNPAVTGPVDDVVCPPYDIISPEERIELLGRSLFNVVRVELPDGRYGEAARLFEGWKKNGVLAREKAPALYGYRMTYQAVDGQARHTFGVMGALVLEPPGHGILPHEQTTPKAKGDRLELIRAVRANTSPIWCLCTEPGLVTALGGAARGARGGGPGPRRRRHPPRAVADRGQTGPGGSGQSGGGQAIAGGRRPSPVRDGVGVPGRAAH